VTVIGLRDAEATEAFGKALAAQLRPGDCVALFGRLGAGKTSLCRGVLHGLGFGGDVASPTFPIVQVYEPPDLRLPVWHVDLYRIEDPEELEELGLDEALQDAALLIEWPERLAYLWPQTLQLILADGPGSGGPAVGRNLSAQVPPAWGDRWPPR
jgi:tRNA threonylcarbamoyladenosine biosynthesis protein TsaE